MSVLAASRAAITAARFVVFSYLEGMRTSAARRIAETSPSWPLVQK